MTNLATTDDQQVNPLLATPLTDTEKTELQGAELAIELAGKNRFEQALIIGEKLSHIYNNALFRGAGGGTWVDYIENRLPEILPEAGGLKWANCRRCLHEVRTLLGNFSRIELDPAQLPTGLEIAYELRALIPRVGQGGGGKWMPAQLDEPSEALEAVWALALKNAEKQERKNGPTSNDVKAAREELRPALLDQGLIREMPQAFKPSAAARMEAAATRREAAEKVVDAETVEENFQKVMDDVKKRMPEIQRKQAIKQVQDALNEPDRKKAEELEDWVRRYNSKLVAASTVINDLLHMLTDLSRIKGTIYLAEMRDTDVMGLISVADDTERIKQMGLALTESMKLAMSLDQPQSIDMSTIDFEELVR